MMIKIKVVVSGVLLLSMPVFAVTAFAEGEVRTNGPLSILNIRPTNTTTVTIFRSGKAVSTLRLPSGDLLLSASRRAVEMTKTGFLVTLRGKTNIVVSQNNKTLFEITAHGDVVKVENVSGK
jgi:hypothetical protein